MEKMLLAAEHKIQNNDKVSLNVETEIYCHLLTLETVNTNKTMDFKMDSGPKGECC